LKNLTNFQFGVMNKKNYKIIGIEGEEKFLEMIPYLSFLPSAPC